ncbi:penicillin acylase family protein [Streptomyces genisteinicus]|uniref:Penicillin acylase family protein n=1 Tax=Streptomyces genisteinicus TaxID=2768068 RepID=A0A7H0I1G5_9ACTN|nr:penicillin acylase family protein [Streptomyces genisteinicus]QNP66631.1 penicillin acylase family protein [Streptomyces genisteinicus]
MNGTAPARLRTADGIVEIALDGPGRPVVHAPTWTAAAYGLGWAVARHRRGQMDLMRRRSHGRLAETSGPPAARSDLRQRTLGLAQVARACWELLPVSQRRTLEAYADGVNAAAPDGPGGAWTPVDCIAVTQGLFQALSSDGQDVRMVEVMRRTLPAAVTGFLLDPQDEFAVGIDGTVPETARSPLPLAELRALMAEPPGPPGPLVVSEGRPVGSNAWAVTDGDTAVLANDMHLELTSPSLMYAARLVVGDTGVTGVTVPGLPVIVAGTNGRIAWGFTRLPADTCEVRELTPGSTPGTYRHDGRDEPFTVRTERVAVLGGDDIGIEVLDTPWGPVVDELRGRPLVLSSNLTDPTALDFSLAGLYECADVTEAADLLNDCGMPPLNALLADTAADVAWTVTGRHPRRAGGPRGFCDAERDVWPTPRLAPHELPRLVSPPSGHVISCNNGDAAGRTERLGWNFFPGTRARRAAASLAADGPHDEARSGALQLDLDAELYAYYRDLALRYTPERAPEPLRSLRDEVLAWRGTSHHDEYGLALLVVFRELLREELFAAVTRPCRRYDAAFTYCYNGHEGPLRRLVDALAADMVPKPWPGPAPFVVAMLGGARALLTKRTGSAGPTRWGSVNVLAPTPLGDDPAGRTGVSGAGLSGCPESLRVTQPDFGAAMRLVVAPARPGEGLLTVPGSPAGTGTADRDHVARWVAGRTHPLPGHDPVPHGDPGDARRSAPLHTPTGRTL